MLGAILEVNILRKVLDYSFIESQVYIPQIECVKDELKQRFITQRASKCGFKNGTLITEMLCPCDGCPKLRSTKYPVIV